MLVIYFISQRTLFTDLVFDMILVSSNTCSLLCSYVSHTEPQLRKVILPWQVPLYTDQTKQGTYYIWHKKWTSINVCHVWYSFYVHWHCFMSVNNLNYKECGKFCCRDIDHAEAVTVKKSEMYRLLVRKLGSSLVH